MKKNIYSLICLWGVIACSPQTAISTIDTVTQQVTDSLLKKAIETSNADWGVAMVMEVETGKVVAQVALERKDSTSFVENIDLLLEPQEPGSLFVPVSILIALDKGIVTPTDSIDTGNGKWSHGGLTITDSSFQRGGYGTISVSQVVRFSSVVGIAKVIDKGYAGDYTRFHEDIKQIGWNSDAIQSQFGKLLVFPSDNSGSKVTIYWNAMGYEIRVSPIGLLTFYNAVANGGKMVLPQTEYCSTIVLTQAIASHEAVQSLQKILAEVVESGTDASIRSEKIKIAAKTGTVQVGNLRESESCYRVSSYAYFPAENPKFSCIVMLNNPKDSYRSGGTMTGEIVKAIAEDISLNVIL